MYRSLLILFSLFLFSQCEQVILEQEEVEESSELGGNINSELAPFFITFQEEARRYGLEIDYESSNVTAQLEQINNGNVAGTCTTNSHNLRDIVIDQSFWDRASPLLREMVIFHELGHCVLGRGHFEGQFNNGVCQSIMRSGLGSCIDAYNANNRDYFIDELFLESD